MSTIPFVHTGFKSVSERSPDERSSRAGLFKKLLPYGLNFLDKALRGILPDDLVLLGAASGIGKTQLCLNIAHANLLAGKRVHMFALEASSYEIEQRLKYAIYADAFFGDPNRPRLPRMLNFVDWALGRFDAQLKQYEAIVERLMGAYSDFHVFYRDADFDADSLVRLVHAVASETDLIICDHVHFFDFHSDNENRELKQIAKKAREVCQIVGKPMILVSHLRKRDRKNPAIIPGLEDFHGSSDLFKIATTAILLAPGERVAGTQCTYETYVRAAKFRKDSEVKQYVARCYFNAAKRQYDKQFELGRLTNFDSEFEPIPPEEIPYWAKPSSEKDFENEIS